MQLLLLLTLLAQASVDGRVVDLGRGKILSGVRVTVVETGASVVTDRNGRFTIPALGPGGWTLRAGEPPYEAIDTTVIVPASGAPPPIEIGLFDQIEAVTVVEVAPREKPAPGGTQVLRDEIVVVPGARGDALTAVQSLPGIAQVGTFNLAGGLIIRGSGPYDSKVFVDGVEVPILYHFFNLQSVLPSEMIDDIVYAPGGFGVEYGRASGGIIEVRSRRGKPEFHGFAEVSFINAAAFLQGPLLGSSHTSRSDPTFTIAFRRSLIDAILPAVIPKDGDLSFTAMPRYYDYQARVDWQPHERWKLAFFLFGTDDTFELVSQADAAADPALTGANFLNTTNFARAVTSAAYESERIKSRTSVSLMTGGFVFEAGPDNHLRFDGGGLSFREESRIKLHDRVSLRAGGEIERWWFNTDVKFPRPPHEGDPHAPNFSFDPPVIDKGRYPITYASGWTGADVNFGPRAGVGAGLRYDGFLHSHDHVFQPRGEGHVTVAQGTTVRAAGGLYTRPPDYNDEFTQTDLNPERAWQTTVGVEQQIRTGLTVQTTGFHTWRRDLIVFDTNRLDTATMDHAYVNRGTGRTYGAEVLLQARGRRAFGWLAYTLSRSMRKDAPGTTERLFDYDQTHNLVLVGSAAFGANDKWRIGGRFQYTTGKPYTPVTGAVFASDLNYYKPEYGLVNSRRFKAQHQLDLRIDRSWSFKRWKLSAYLDITNVYLHPAPLQQQDSYDFSESMPIESVPILPAFGVRGEF